MTTPAAIRPHDPNEFRSLWMDLSVPIVEIGRRYGVSEPTACRMAAREGLPPRMSFNESAKYRTPRFKRLWHDPNVTLREIGEEFGVSPSNVYKAGVRRGWPGKLYVRAGRV